MMVELRIKGKPMKRVQIESLNDVKIYNIEYESNGNKEIWEGDIKW